MARGTVVAGAWLASRARSGAAAQPASRLHIATNQYPWGVFYRRQKKDFAAQLESGLAEVAQSGMDGFEPMIAAPADVDRFAPLLEKNKLQMRSIYVNSVLHDAAEADKSVASILAIGERAKRAGTRIIVTNPSPVRWGGGENKTNAQLKLQARAMNKLGEELARLGLVLAYHNHDIELRNAAREFHHMMVGTNPAHVTLCLDAHWVYRGAGDSAVALFDVLKLYGPRVSELHLRQSVNNIWTEVFGEGDIDYPALAAYLKSLGIKPHLVLEQCPEEKTPKTLEAVEAHRRGRAYAERVFAALVS